MLKCKGILSSDDLIFSICSFKTWEIPSAEEIHSIIFPLTSFLKFGSAFLSAFVDAHNAVVIKTIKHKEAFLIIYIKKKIFIKYYFLIFYIRVNLLIK